jgi:hypothetical protein
MVRPSSFLSSWIQKQVDHIDQLDLALPQLDIWSPIIGGDQPDNVHLEPATIAPIREHIALQAIPTGSVRSSETPTPSARQRTGCALVPTISAARGSAPHIR